MILYCHVARSGQDVVIDHLMPTSLFVYECTCNSVKKVLKFILNLLSVNDIKLALLDKNIGANVCCENCKTANSRSKSIVVSAGKSILECLLCVVPAGTEYCKHFPCISCCYVL